jgi:hypothetical protein
MQMVFKAMIMACSMLALESGAGPNMAIRAMAAVRCVGAAAPSVEVRNGASVERRLVAITVSGKDEAGNRVSERIEISEAVDAGSSLRVELSTVMSEAVVIEVHWAR